MHPDDPGSKWPAVRRYAFIGFGVIAAYFLVMEHRAHFFGALPYLLVLACPLMHLFHQHGGHDRRGDDDASGTAHGH